MIITPPKLPPVLTPIGSFASYAKAFLQNDSTIEKVESKQERCENDDFYKADVRMSIFENCIFHNCSFEKSSFIDVMFQSCDLSNSSFQGAYFERCRFISCKGLGVDMVGAMYKHTTFEACNLRYANFNTAKLYSVLFDHVDFTEASIAEATVKNFFTNESRFQRNDFHQTLLQGVDFSNSILLSPIVSVPPVEVKGMTINMLQAADLVGLWGIVVK